MIYYPILRHSDAEMNAFRTLKSATQKLIFPIIEGKRIKKDQKNHWNKSLNSAGNYVKQRINSQPFIYDFRNMFDNLQDYNTEIKIDNINPVEYIINKFTDSKLEFVPCINHDSPEWVIKSILKSTPKEIAVRIRYYDMEPALHNPINNHVIDTLNTYFPDQQVTIILDFKDKFDNSQLISNINFFNNMQINRLILSITTLDITKDVDKMSFEKVSDAKEISIFNTLKQNYSKILFSDYTTRLTPEPDLRKGFNMNNSYLKVYYTTDKGYYLGKSKKFDDGEPENFQEVCKKITSSKLFKGRNYSSGDRKIEECALRQIDILNHKTTIEISINHHMEYTIDHL